jgi:uncharacterized RDD family membrane protein YckC
METQDTTQLTDFENTIDYVPVSAGTRFANYLIDTVFYYVFVFLFVFGLLFTTKDARLAEEAEQNIGMQYLVGGIIFLLYFTLTEFGFKGRTLGKFITGTKAINADGSNLTFKDAFLRSLSRLVPFEPFSFLGTGASGWHDKWTKTIVIKVQK